MQSSFDKIKPFVTPVAVDAGTTNAVACPYEYINPVFVGRPVSSSLIGEGGVSIPNLPYRPETAGDISLYVDPFQSFN
jgi:hypothetical protein